MRHAETGKPLPVQRFSVAGRELLLEDSPEVWLPHDPTFRFLDVISSDQILNHSIRGKRVLDIGTGSGIIGIFALLEGSTYVSMTDVNPRVLDHVLKNLELNGMRGGDYQFAVADIDAFMGIQESFDTIISNPPVQPINPNAHIDNPAAKFNETLNGGRYLLDTIIKYSRSYLTADGRLYLLCSGRHGHETTKEMLDSYYGAGNWSTLMTSEYAIDPEYHGPYMNYWISEQKKDGDIRVYVKDQAGNITYPDSYDPALSWFSLSYVIEGRNLSQDHEVEN